MAHLAGASRGDRVLLLGLASTSACTKDSDGERGRTVSTEKPDIHAVERELGIRFPEGARLIGTHREDGMDDYLGVKVEMPAEALAGFLASCPIPKERYASGNGGLLGPDQDGFGDPNKQPKLRTGQAQLPGARALNIGFDDSRPDVALVYVVNHGT
jgi:hypothetical protein